jgi:CheY-like chemotaxis protein/anti-sigma regulatory factor (Ser/Thr protein kinase)
MADPTRLAQIVGNLLHNASKFTPEEGHVQVSLTHENDRAVIRIVDSGVGIAPEQLPRVFDMFTRREKSTLGTNGGLGIGLALSRRLAEMHDGEITVASPGVGKGTVFTFSLPAETGTSESASEPLARPPRSNRTNTVNVLVIEDNEDSAEVLAMSLEGWGYVASVAHTGAAGLALLQETRPRIVLCDIGLPEMDGIEVCKRVRALELGYTPVMIALTGWGMQQDVRRTQESGFDHHLVKPVAPETLFDLLDRLSEPLT